MSQAVVLRMSSMTSLEALELLNCWGLTDNGTATLTHLTSEPTLNSHMKFLSAPSSPFSLRARSWGLHSAPFFSVETSNFSGSFGTAATRERVLSHKTPVLYFTVRMRAVSVYVSSKGRSQESNVCRAYQTGPGDGNNSVL